MDIVGSKWIYKTMFKSDGSLEPYKAHFVAEGHTQVSGVDLMKHLHLFNLMKHLQQLQFM